jgi:phosphoribosyl 1,2-cyclic phosphodiesterase
MAAGPLRLAFPGTRGEIDVRTDLHKMHSCLSVAGRVLIDCGADWLGRLDVLKAHAILLTHAHPDHAGGLKRGSPGEVYATADTWERLGRYPILDRRVVRIGHPWAIQGITFEAFSVEHSLVAPAVGYRITAGGASAFYAPDLVYIHERHKALSDIAVYIGDGASIARPLVRRRGSASIGHASIRDQLDWCSEEGVPRAVITHCGSQIVKADPQAVADKIAALGEDRGVKALVAHDGLTLTVRPATTSERRRDRGRRIGTGFSGDHYGDGGHSKLATPEVFNAQRNFLR